MTLSFETSERLSTSTDLGGVREPVVKFISDKDEIGATRLTVQSGNTDGTLWQAELEIAESDESHAALKAKGEGFFGFKISVQDKTGNERLVHFADDGNNLTQQNHEDEGSYRTKNESGYRARFDMKAPVLSGLSLATTNLGIT
ncbi:MAG: hypothetical protein QF691_13425, partial [SAR324 cluster bacterium]|nr:hypothetical protein [SAR324 cluster bacterium]